MQVILLERVEKLGQMGQVVDVKAGFARNFLLPKKKALRATQQNLGFFDNKRVELEATNLKRKSEAQEVAVKMDGAMVNLIRQASEMGHLYGSVRSADIVQGLDQGGFKISRSQVNIDVPIKYLGMHQVRVLLHPEVAIMVNVNVAQSEEEAVVQAAAHAKGAVSTAEEGKELSQTQKSAAKKTASRKKDEEGVAAPQEEMSAE